MSHCIEEDTPWKTVNMSIQDTVNKRSNRRNRRDTGTAPVASDSYKCHPTSTRVWAQMSLWNTAGNRDDVILLSQQVAHTQRVLPGWIWSQSVRAAGHMVLSLGRPNQNHGEIRLTIKCFALSKNKTMEPYMQVNSISRRIKCKMWLVSTNSFVVFKDFPDKLFFSLSDAAGNLWLQMRQLVS